MAELTVEDVREILNGIEILCSRIAVCYDASDSVELETCGRRMEEYLRVLVAVSASQSMSSVLGLYSGRIFNELVDCLAILLNCISNTTFQRDKTGKCVPVSDSTGGRPGYDISKEQIETLREAGMNWKSIASCLGVSERTIYRRRIEFGLSENYSEITDEDLDDVIKMRCMFGAVLKERV